MRDLKWSGSERKLARELFDTCLNAELAETLATVKTRAALARSPAEMWELEEFLARKRLEIDHKYDYRHSQLLFVFGHLLREGRLREADLAGLSEEKRASILRIAQF